MYEVSPTSLPATRDQFYSVTLILIRYLWSWRSHHLTCDFFSPHFIWKCPISHWTSTMLNLSINMVETQSTRHGSNTPQMWIRWTSKQTDWAKQVAIFSLGGFSQSTEQLHRATNRLWNGVLLLSACLNWDIGALGFGTRTKVSLHGCHVFWCLDWCLHHHPSLFLGL